MADMHRLSVNGNLCTILSKSSTGSSRILGTGCLIRTGNQTGCEVATSKTVLKSRNDDKLFAQFVNRRGKPIDLELDTELKDYVNCEIAIFPVELPDAEVLDQPGILIIKSNKSNFNEAECSIFVNSTANPTAQPVQFLLKNGRLESTHSPLVSINLLEEGDQYNLAVRGAPVVNNRFEFVGIVDFPDATEKPSILMFPQCTSESDFSMPTQDTQPTGKFAGKKDTRLEPDAFLEKLWENQYFIDDLCKALDPKYSADYEIKDHRHLAQEFEIPNDIRKAIAGSEKSPSEGLFQRLESSHPGILIKEFCEVLKTVEANSSCRIIERAIKDGKLSEGDLLSELADKDMKLKSQLILDLDYGNHWKKISNKYDIKEKEWSTFSRDPEFNLARNFFEILHTQSPRMKVSNLKEHLKKLGQNNLCSEMSNISDEAHLKDLSSEAALMCDVIEPKLNSMENQLLYKLAEKFQKQGYLKDIDIEIFRSSESKGSPTSKLMDYILTSKEEQFTIRDLKDRLEIIGRNDCCQILTKYVKGCDVEENPVQIQPLQNKVKSLAVEN